MDRTALVVGVTGIARLQHRAGAVGGRLAGGRAVPLAARTRSPASSTCYADVLDPESVERAVAGRGDHPPVLHHLVAAGRPRRRTAGSTARCWPTRSRRCGRTTTLAARGAGDRPQALPRPVRGVRVGAGRHAVPGEPGRGCRSRTSTTTRRTSSSPPPTQPGLLLVGAPSAHDDRLRPRQRDEHGRHPRGVRHASAASPGSRSSSREARSSTAASPTSPTPGCSAGTPSGRPPSPPRATRPSTPSTATSSDGGRCGPGWPRDSASRPAEYPGAPKPLEGRMDHADEVWAGLVAAARPGAYTASELASWWHTDADLGREVETFADMSKSRALGFLDFQGSIGSFLDLFDSCATPASSPAGSDAVLLQRGLGHLAYSTLVHPGDTWAEMRESLETYAPAVKARVSPDAPYGRLAAALRRPRPQTLTGDAGRAGRAARPGSTSRHVRLHGQRLPLRPVQGPRRDGARLRARLVDRGPGRATPARSPTSWPRSRRRRSSAHRSRPRRWRSGPR